MNSYSDSLDSYLTSVKDLESKLAMSLREFYENNIMTNMCRVAVEVDEEEDVVTS